MQRTKNIFFAAVCCTLLIWRYSVDASAPDNRGTEFILAVGENYPVSTYQVVELFIATDEDEVDVNVSVPLLSSTYPSQTVKVYKGHMTKVEIDKTVRMSGLSLEEKGILIQSSGEIVVFATNKVPKSSDSFLVLPVDVLGTLYFGIAYYHAKFGGSGPQVGIIASQNDTTVTFTMPPNRSVGTWLTYQGTAVNDSSSFNITLQRFQTFQLLVVTDLTGVKVESDKPVAMVSGNKRTYVIDDGSSDHIEDMIPPVNTWGRTFITTPFAERTGGDIFRIIASESNTTVMVTNTTTPGVTNYTLEYAGDFTQLDVPSDEYLYIRSDKAIFLCQYSKTGKYDGAHSDPMMMYVPPVELYSNKYPVATVEAVLLPYTNYINIAIQTKDVDGLRLDGEPIMNYTYVSDTYNTTWRNISFYQSNWTEVANSGYSVNTLFVPHGAYVLSHTSRIVSFGAFMYGQVEFESYGYPAGSRYANIGDYCAITNTTADDGVDNDCDGRVDEEFMNGQDDDGDGQVDEDIVYTEVVTTTGAPTTPTLSTTTTQPATTTVATTTTQSPTTTIAQATTTTTESTTSTTDAPTTTQLTTTTRSPTTTSTQSPTTTTQSSTTTTESPIITTTQSLATTTESPTTAGNITTETWLTANATSTTTTMHTTRMNTTQSPTTNVTSPSVENSTLDYFNSTTQTVGVTAPTSMPQTIDVSLNTPSVSSSQEYQQRLVGIGIGSGVGGLVLVVVIASVVAVVIKRRYRIHSLAGIIADNDIKGTQDGTYPASLQTETESIGSMRSPTRSIKSEGINQNTHSPALPGRPLPSSERL